jgi:hypothetical protein
MTTTWLTAWISVGAVGVVVPPPLLLGSAGPLLVALPETPEQPANKNIDAKAKTRGKRFNFFITSSRRTVPFELAWMTALAVLLAGVAA